MEFTEALEQLNFKLGDLIFTKDGCGNLSKLKQRYRKYTLTHHPDKGGDVNKFKKIVKAYAFLLNHKPKAQRNRHGSSSIFGTKTTVRAKGKLEPQDAIIHLKVHIEKLHKGYTERLKYTIQKACELCGGKVCNFCHGQIDTMNMTTEVVIHSSLMNSNYDIIYDGYGDQLVEHADLVIKLEILPSNRFKLEKKPNVELPVVVIEKFVPEDIVGKKIIVQTLDGPIKITIPKGHKDTIRLPGRGLIFDTHKGMVRGDQYIKLNYIKQEPDEKAEQL